ncbi:hypothetical protein [Methylobacterium phyllosphaerae]|nr:hypothetical protein [Methylobacterium phyllosphaerae]
MTAQGGALRSAWLRAPPQNRRAIFPMCYGNYYVARDTRRFAHEPGLIPKTTPLESLLSNGMAEAFVRTLKRDYVCVSVLPDAESVLRQLPVWLAH